jgi:hypothetical protein
MKDIICWLNLVDKALHNALPVSNLPPYIVPYTELEFYIPDALQCSHASSAEVVER